jgi:hypothetical protein
VLLRDDLAVWQRLNVTAFLAGGLKLVGLAVHGPRNAVDKVLKGATLHT